MKSKIGYGFGYLLAVVLVSTICHFVMQFLISHNMHRESVLGIMVLFFLVLNRDLKDITNRQRLIIKNQHYFADMLGNSLNKQPRKRK